MGVPFGVPDVDDNPSMSTCVYMYENNVYDISIIYTSKYTYVHIHIYTHMYIYISHIHL